MSGRVRTRLADGRWVRGFRKTLRRIARRRAGHEMPAYRLTALLPDAWALRAPGDGATGVIGVTVEHDPISGLMAVATGKDLGWVAAQMATFLLAAAAGDERIIMLTAKREGEADQYFPVALTPWLAAVRLSNTRTVKVTG